MRTKLYSLSTLLISPMKYLLPILDKNNLRLTFKTVL